jgi:hypothetical protein
MVASFVLLGALVNSAQIQSEVKEVWGDKEWTVLDEPRKATVNDTLMNRLFKPKITKESEEAITRQKDPAKAAEAEAGA